ncbi:Tl [Trypoxylus dichotomus]
MLTTLRVKENPKPLKTVNWRHCSFHAKRNKSFSSIRSYPPSHIQAIAYVGNVSKLPKLQSCIIHTCGIYRIDHLQSNNFEIMKIVFVPLLLFIAFLSNARETVGQFACKQSPKACDCFEIITGETQLYCPTKEQKDVILVYKRKGLQITCFNNLTFDIGSLVLNIDKVDSLKIQHCKQLTESFLVQLRNASLLKLLDMVNTHLDDDHARLLSNYTSKAVEVISLSRSELTKLPEELNFVYELELANNRIKNLTEKIKFPLLIVLKLQQNDIKRIDGSVFETSPDLAYIDLSQNNITELPAQLLHPLPRLKILLLRSNAFQRIPDGFFEMNSILKEIDFSDGRLTEIGTNTFSSCTRLEKIKFGSNSLKSLPEEIFLNMQNLTYLELSMNEFSDFPEGTFKGLSRLQYLYLFDNKLVTWSANHSAHLGNLRFFHLNNNRLSVIKADTFFGLSNLQELKLSYNLIATIEIKAFSSLSRLKRLDLSFNKLTTMLLEITYDAVPTALLINLASNNISNIAMPNYTGIDHSPPKPLIFILNNNHINCDCNFFSVLKHIDTKSQTKLITLSGNETCTSPAEFKGIKLTDITMDNFTCKSDELYQCPQECDCVLHPSKGILQINCPNAGLHSPPVINPLQIAPTQFGADLSEIWVDLSNNSIGEFTTGDLSYKNVSVLNLSHNQLRKIDWIPEKIEMLYLGNNMLSEIDENVLKMLNRSTTLKQMFLNENPWKCDCEMVHFAKTLRLHLRKKINNTLTCKDGSALMDLDEATACGLEGSYVVLIVILSVIMLFSIILIILYIHFGSHVKIWLYNHKLLLSIINEKDADKNMTYDAFISYSHKDEEFVAKHLLPELEHHEKYKLCLHERDWIVGEYIPKQIEDSVQNSRRTIIVLSKNFLASDWANMEFERAHSKSLLDERNRLIVILYEDIDMNDISNKELKMYLNTKTYIKWGDPWFWKKLKQAMPVRKLSINDNRRKSRKNWIVNVEKSIDSS